MLNYEELGKQIKKYRKLKKLTQNQLGELINKTESSIRKYEKGIIQIPLPVIEQIAKKLDISISKLLTDQKIDLWEYDEGDLFSDGNLSEIIDLENVILKRIEEDLTKLFYLKYEENLTEEEKKVLSKEILNYIDYSLEKIKNIKFFGQPKEPIK